MFYGIVITLSILYRAIKKISSNLSKVRREKRERGKKEAMWWKDEKYLELSRNLHNRGIPGAGERTCVDLTRFCSPVDRDQHGCFALCKYLFLLEWQRHLLHSTAGKGNDSSQLFNSSGKLVYLERRSLLLELSWLNANYRKFHRVCTCHIRNIVYMGIFHNTNTIHTGLFGIRENTFVSQKLFLFVAFV